MPNSTGYVDAAGIPRVAGTVVALILTVAGIAWPGRLVCQAVRDSAGVRIVENRAPAWTAATAWRFSADPVLQIGSVDGDSAVLFNRTQYATRLSDGRIVVAQTSSLRVFSPSGAFLQTIGRRGRGPGEFGLGISGMAALQGDSIAVNQSRSVVIFDPRGNYVRSWTSVPPGLVRDHRAEGASLLPDGSALLNLYEPEPREWKVGVIRPPRGFVRVTADGRVDTAGFFPGLEQVVTTGGARPEIDIRPFGHRTMVTAGGDRLYIGDNATYEIRAYTMNAAADETNLVTRESGSRSGGLRPELILRRTSSAVPVTAADRTAWGDTSRARLASIPAARRSAEAPAVERMIANADFPRTHPPYTQMRADRLGNLWVTETSARSGGIGTLTVYDRAGRLLGAVTPPARVTILEIGADYMLGLWKNEDDVEFVRMYSLIKP